MCGSVWRGGEVLLKQWPSYIIIAHTDFSRFSGVCEKGIMLLLTILIACNLQPHACT